MSDLPRLVLSPWGYIPHTEALTYLRDGREVPEETTVWDHASGDWMTVHWHEPGVLEKHLNIGTHAERSRKRDRNCVYCGFPGRWSLHTVGTVRRQFYCTEHLRERLDELIDEDNKSLTIQIRGPQPIEDELAVAQKQKKS